MSPSVDFLAHAAAAVERTRRSLTGLRAGIGAGMAGMSQPSQCLAEDILLGLDRRYAIVMDAYRDMEHADPDALPRLWRRFLACYDGYLEAARLAKFELANDAYIEDIAAKLVVDDPRAPPGGGDRSLR